MAQVIKEVRYMFGRRKGQTTLEYAVIIVVVVAALLAIQYYMKRGVEGRLRESVDSVGEQYSAGNTTSKFTTQQTGAQVTKETFGLDKNDVATQGISYYEVITPAKTTHSAKGDTDKETVTKAANPTEESLF
jgi:hypothetical protein